MTPKCIGALLVRNEAGPSRYLKRVLDNVNLYCDGIVVLDDGSTDDTVAICKAHPGVTKVVEWGGAGFWTDESEGRAREQLWKLACEKAGPEGWVYVADADHLLQGLTPQEFKVLLTSEHSDAVAFPLWDCWDSEETQRVDGFWQAWRTPRAWLFKAKAGPFPSRGIHVGHAPSLPWRPLLAPAGAGIAHLGYVERAARLLKMTRYIRLGASLSPQERAHAESVGDLSVTLAPTPPTHKPRILVGAVVRKPPQVVAAFLKCLQAQELRKPAHLEYHFVTDFAKEPYKDEVLAMLRLVPNATVVEAGNEGGDYGDGAATRNWTPKAWHRVGALKNSIFQRAMDEKFDAVWLVDADVMCDPGTLQSLCDVEAPIVSAVYWTHWMKQAPGAAQVIHAAPQVWLRHPCHLSEVGTSEAEFRKKLVERGLIRVGGLGACTLFLTAALTKGVSFAPIPEGLPPGPMADGEDRHLCERARRLHIPLLADSWSDVWHAYHQSDYADIPKWLGRFASPRIVAPSRGDLVSLKIEMTEPIPAPADPNRLQYVGPQFVRGRLGQLPLLPELEEALSSMSVGERRLVRVHFPAHFPYATLVNQTRIVSITLFDAKPYHMPPVIEEELFVGPASGAWMDATTLTAERIEEVAAEGVAV